MSVPVSERPIRVAQVATGAVGSIALRVLAADPRFELAGLWVHSEAKAGKDAGELVGLPPTGVRATRDIDQIIAARPDCVSFMALEPDVALICKVLAAGIDVVTVSGITWPAAADPRLAARLEAACQAGASRFHGTGLSPGFASDMLPAWLTGLCRSVEAIEIDEFADIRSYESRELIHDLVGMGQPLAALERAGTQLGAMLHPVYAQSIHMIAAALGVTVEEVARTQEYAASPSGGRIASGPLAPGGVGGVRIGFVGRAGGEDRIRLNLTWIVADDLGPGWPAGGEGADTRWRIRVSGEPALQCDLQVGADGMAPGAGVGPSLVATCMHALNAIPVLRPAPPGVRTRLDLPVVAGPLRG